MGVINNSNVIQINSCDRCNSTEDPTSLWCDEFLEDTDPMVNHCKCYASTPSSFSTTSESTSYSRDLYVASRLRSRSEEKKRNSEHSLHIFHSAVNHLKLYKCFNNVSSACGLCSCPDDKLRSGVYSEKSKNLDTSQAVSQHFKRKENLPSKSSLSVYCCGDSDSVPPAMALINVNRLQNRELNSFTLNKNRMTVTNQIFYDSNNDFNVPESKLTKLFLTASRKSLPSIHLDCDLEVSKSSGTSSLSDTAVIGNETGYISPDKSPTLFADKTNKHYLSNLNFGQTGTSARDSGLSSHSSNSVNYSPSTLPPPHKGLAPRCQSSFSQTPPPVPRHAPQSQAMVALAQRKGCSVLNTNTISVPYENDLTKCTCSKSVGNNKMAVERIRGTTIRLHSHKKIESHFQSSLSPIWKRKPNISSVVDKYIQLTEQQQYIYSSSFQSTKSKDSDDKREQIETTMKAKNVIDISQYKPNTSTKNHEIMNNSCLLLNDSVSRQQQDDCCTFCILNWQFYLSQPCNYTFIDNVKCYYDMNKAWYFIKHDCFIKSTVQLIKPDQCLNCRKHIYAVGVNLFNRNPLRGLKYLARHNYLNLSSSEEISKFIQNNPDLCRSKIGAFLGLPPTDEISPTEVTMILLKSLNISGLEVDEALRLVVNRFGMPVESQEIDRLLQCISEYYHKVRWCSTSVGPFNASFPNSNGCQMKSLPAPITVDQLSLLFYAILLLQTSLHNVNAAKSSLGKQNVSQFVKNVHDLLLSQSPSSSSSYLMTKSKRDDFDANHYDVVDERHTATMKECIINDSNGYSNNNKANDIKHLFSNRKLTEIFYRIKVRPLAPGMDQTTIVRHIAKAIRNLNEVKLYNTNKDNESVFSNTFDLVESHRRLICYCTVIHIIQNQPPQKETTILRHLFVFNDLVIIAKDSTSKRHSGRRLIFDKSKQKHSKTDGLSLSCRYNDVNDILRPPLDLLMTDYDKTTNIESNASTCIQPSVACVPYGNSRRSRSKNECHSRKAANATHSHSYTRLTALYVFSLFRCKIRPFKTDVYRYGIEFWRFPKEALSSSSSSQNKPTVNQQNQRIDDLQPEQLILIAALAKNDYNNLLHDLYEALYETNHVAMELDNFMK
ncbi:Brefeldin A-inhibited guanine nucleotide-exchange protein [Schistosoma japonicum]|uniref:Brefeldin A-inhibited guanine nucleotide-exchange protein n=1 Tax=Schistosoma japonicum TaxID=6182 RepID=A0A4Z2CWJ4_SCHJA|nr:Brefeldin A-inhibited guanine nucleotide-exchange protein [Schistosoma japonicum]